MDKIRDWLYIGKHSETIDEALLKSHGITAMLQLAEAVKQEGIVSRYLPVEDGEPLRIDLLEEGIDFIRQQKTEDKRILVACGAGISRSTLFCMAALMEIEKQNLFQAFRSVYEVHPMAFPHYELGLVLAAYYGIPMTAREFTDGLYKVQKELE